MKTDSKVKFGYGTKILEHIELLPWQKDVLIQMLRGEKKELAPPPGVGAGGGKTYMGAVLAYTFVTWAALDCAKVIVINPTMNFLTYLNGIIDGSPIKALFERTQNKIWIWEEYHRFVLLLNLERPEQITGYFGNLLFILDRSCGYQRWAEDIIKASIQGNNCFVYRARRE